MKKISLIALFAALVMSVNAEDLWTGSKHISWEEGGVELTPENLANVKAGNILKVHYTGASTDLEFKVMKAGAFYNMPGTRMFEWISDNGAFEQFLTPTAVEAIKAYGLQIIGGNFTCTKVELLDGKVDDLKEGYTFWTGFRWIENDKTYEFYYSGQNIDWSQYKELVIYHEAGTSDYAINIRTNWDANGIISDGGAHETKYDDKLVLDLSEINVNSIIANTNADRIMFQCFVPASFNMTDIVLVPKENGGATAIDNTVMGEKAIKTFENGQLVIIKNGVKYNAMGAQL